MRFISRFIAVVGVAICLCYLVLFKELHLYTTMQGTHICCYSISFLLFSNDTFSKTQSKILMARKIVYSDRAHAHSFLTIGSATYMWKVRSLASNRGSSFQVLLLFIIDPFSHVSLITNLQTSPLALVQIQDRSRPQRLSQVSHFQSLSRLRFRFVHSPRRYMQIQRLAS